MNDEVPFAQSILHTTDFSPASDRAFAHALAIALLRQADLTLLHCGPEGSEEVDWASFPQIRETLGRWGLFEPGSDEAAVWHRFKMSVEKRSVKSEHPALAATKFLRESPHDFVVLATESGQSPSRWLRHSTAETIARWSRTTTLFVPSEASRGLIDLDSGEVSFRNVLVAVDHDPNPDAAIEYARRATELLGDEPVTITVLHVGDVLPDLPPMDDGERWRWQIEQRQGDPKTTILSCAHDVQADLIVMTTAGVDSILDALRGNTSERVLRESPCPVLVVNAS